MNMLEKTPQRDVAGPKTRQKATQGMVGNGDVGGGAPIVVQSRTNTDTADIDGTVKQVADLFLSFSDIVLFPFYNPDSAPVVPPIFDPLPMIGFFVPVICVFPSLLPPLLLHAPPLPSAFPRPAAHRPRVQMTTPPGTTIWVNAQGEPRV